MHTHDPPYAHNDVKPGNVLLSLPQNRPPVAVIMDFGSAGPARRELQTRKEAMAVQVHAEFSHSYHTILLWLSLTMLAFCDAAGMGCTTLHSSL